MMRFGLRVQRRTNGAPQCAPEDRRVATTQLVADCRTGGATQTAADGGVQRGAVSDCCRGSQEKRQQNRKFFHIGRAHSLWVKAFATLSASRRKPAVECITFLNDFTIPRRYAVRMSATLVSPIRGMGFVPGVARGKLTRRPATNGILLADHKTLRSLSARPAGCVLVDAAPFSHASIALLSRGIPTVMVGAREALQLHEGVELVLDGASGRVLPSETQDADLTPSPPRLPGDLRTRDGERVEMRASVRSAAAVRLARERGLAGIGLVRTEFLLPEAGAMPDRAFYEEAFEALLEAARQLPVTLRLLDLAPDKHPGWASALPDSGPLGLHGSRLYRHPVVGAVVEAQLQALGPLSRRFDVGLLVPNVDTLEQFRQWRDSINAALPGRGVRVGAMLETPGAALAVDGFLATADLVGFGLNDLMQSLFGADRDLPAVRARLDPYAPALYRFLRLAAELAGPAAGRVQLCGILPQLPGVMPVLLGLGYRTFSVDVAHAPYLARTVATRSAAEDRGLAGAVCAAASGQAVADLLGVWYEGER
jgi:phosphoenolpyruvate-protein kinase (PTS system EI component)